MKQTAKIVPQDRLYLSDNEYEIPILRIDRQPETGLLMPFAPWGANARRRSHVGTIHFYVDDYRFNNIWLHPEKLIYTGCREVVDPNFSLFQTTPIAYGLQLLYKKRWIARWLQECGIRVWVDLNVAPKFRELNKLGVPKGYKAFATRGHEGELCHLEAEWQIAKEISGVETPNMIVYGGGETCKSFCRQRELIYIDPYQVDQRKSRKEVDNG